MVLVLSNTKYKEGFSSLILEYDNIGEVILWAHFYGPQIFMIVMINADGFCGVDICFTQFHVGQATNMGMVTNMGG
jgi:hypothetical protein